MITRDDYWDGDYYVTDCPECDGTGNAPELGIRACPFCHGTGELSVYCGDDGDSDANGESV